MKPFIHLHNHSDYSLLDGAQTVESLIKRTKALNMPAVALTEHGNLFSAIHFYKVAHDQGIKPIIGSEVYFTPDRFAKKSKRRGGLGYNHLLLLAMNYEGYRNLVRLVSLGYTEGFYYRPRIDWELLEKYNKGLIATSACIKGAIQSAALKEDMATARQIAQRHAQIFNDRFYLEVQNHQLKEELIWHDIAKQLSQELGLPRIATNDAHYAEKDHWKAHDAHLCIGTGKDLADPDRMKYDPPHYWLKTQAEMQALFPGDEEVIENTWAIVERCNLSLEFDRYYLPQFPIPKEEKDVTPDDYLSQLVFKGLEERYPEITAQIKARAAHELSVIRDMGFAGYFLIVQDFVRYAKESGIPVGPGRGSAAGSIVCYATGITDIDPLKYNLIFERFLNPERINMPDIDIDFCDERRGKVIDYIRQKYGQESVCHIITFGKMKAKAVIRDVGRVMNVPLSEVDRIAKMVPERPGVSLQEALKENSDLKQASEVDDTHKKLFEISMVLEGMNRHASTHAAGVVVAPGKLIDYVPLYKPRGGEVTTQYDMKCVEEIGLLKVDFLGLRNLSVIEKTLHLLKERDVELDIEDIPDQDEKTLALFGQGNTIGVFQFESSGMREYLKKLQPSSIEDLIAMNALYRPGPMDMIDEFIARKHGKAEINYLHPDLKPILKDTYGIIVYQEQVMQIGAKIAGFSMGKADLMRRAMGKKKVGILQDLEKEFIQGAQEKGLDKKVAEEIYSLIFKFASYGFNKSHSAAYAILAYRIGYLKAHYPIEFMAANLTTEMNNSDRVAILSAEVVNMDSEILPPDVNKSDVFFTPEKGSIRFGLNAIKNVGEKAAESIVKTCREAGPFDSFFEFVIALDLKKVNRKALEGLVLSGAMDSMEGSRAQKFRAIDLAVRHAQKIQGERNTNQVSLFGGSGEEAQSVILEPQLPEIDPWSDEEQWAREKEMLGMYLSGHPLMKYAYEIETFSNFHFEKPLQKLNGKKVQLGGLISAVRLRNNRRNQRFAYFNLQSLQGSVRVLTFAKVYKKYWELIREDNTVFVEGKVDIKPGSDPVILLDDITPLMGLSDRKSKRIHILLDSKEFSQEQCRALKELISKHKGTCELMFHISDQNGYNKKVRSKSIKVCPDKKFITEFKKHYGNKSIWVET